MHIYTAFFAQQSFSLPPSGSSPGSTPSSHLVPPASRRLSGLQATRLLNLTESTREQPWARRGAPGVRGLYLFDPERGGSCDIRLLWGHAPISGVSSTASRRVGPNRYRPWHEWLAPLRGVSDQYLFGGKLRQANFRYVLFLLLFADFL